MMLDIAQLAVFPEWAALIAGALLSPEMELEGCQDPATGEWCLLFFQGPERSGAYLPLRLHHELTPEAWGARWAEHEQWRIERAFADGKARRDAERRV